LKNAMTKAQAHQFRDRWRLVNEREAEELRTTSIDVKWQQFVTLFLWARQFEWPAEREKEVATVRARWARLRKFYRAKKNKS
jgi:hypothetical protein